MTKLTNPRPLFLNARGNLLDGGFVYVGVANADPESNPIEVFWDAALTIPAAQPLRTMGGVIVNGAAPAFVFFEQEDFSYRVRDAEGDLVDYVPSLFSDLPAFQPLDSDLTAIAALTTTPFGRSLLTLANQAALKAATGIPDPLPIAGGVLSGNVTRQGAGGLAYSATGTYPTMRIFGPEHTTDPTTQPGDIWFKANG